MEKRIYDFSYMQITPLNFYKCLADDTRLKSLLLIQDEGELCVCELTAALGVSQPKISRHLAQLRACGLLADRRQGQWVYYRIHPNLPTWAREVLSTTLAHNANVIAASARKLCSMGNRPQRQNQCC